MVKNNTLQRYVFKIHSSRIIGSGYHLNLTLEDARRTEELIALSESQLMRYIDRLNGQENVSERIAELKFQLKKLKNSRNKEASRPKIISAYAELDSLTFKKDYICIVMDRAQDYRDLCEKRFTVNGISFHRLLGTPGGIKKSTVVFVNSELYPFINSFVDCGRNPEKEFIPAKLEAYKALVCSSSIPVSSPQGVIVINDCITHFTDTVIKLDDSETEEPVMTVETDYEISLNANDGYGMAMPSLMKRWSEDLGLEEMMPGCVVRNAFCKGAVCPVDFQKFCIDSGHTMIRDVWGYEHDIRNIELVLTESMLKLWDSYSSVDDYLSQCEYYGYDFCITKNAESELENQRTLNYQFIQSYDFTDEELDELVSPTIEEIKDIMSFDYRKTILYAGGDTNVWTKALMIEPSLINDPYIYSQIYGMIRNRIDRAKVGVLNIPGNYALALGDPYSLCQSMCGMEVTGLLKAGEVYSKYWLDRGQEQIIVFRAPMTSHNNIRKLNVVCNSEMAEFYQYITTPTIFNSWDTCSAALNGMDFDGDCTINTSNDLLLRKHIAMPSIECIQRKGKKIVPTDQDMMESNIKSFGNEVGAVTNRATGMFDVQVRYGKDTEEWKILDYRIKCSQLYQQNSIDATKGIEVKPMPKYWYDWQSVRLKDDDSNEEREFKLKQQKVISDKKPYFMQYIYPDEKKKYLDYIESARTKCVARFGMTLDHLINKQDKDAAEQKFVDIYYQLLPVSNNNCVINRICRKIEQDIAEFHKKKPKNFDYSILRCEADYSDDEYTAIRTLYYGYQNSLSEFMAKAKKTRIRDEDRIMQKYLLTQEFEKKCYETVADSGKLCNILLDICYGNGNNKSKQFVWDMCGDVIISNLLHRNGNVMHIPEADENGDIEFGGKRYVMKEVSVNGDIE